VRGGGTGRAGAPIRGGGGPAPKRGGFSTAAAAAAAAAARSRRGGATARQGRSLLLPVAVVLSLQRRLRVPRPFPAQRAHGVHGCGRACGTARTGCVRGAAVRAIGAAAIRPGLGPEPGPRRPGPPAPDPEAAPFCVGVSAALAVAARLARARRHLRHADAPTTTRRFCSLRIRTRACTRAPQFRPCLVASPFPVCSRTGCARWRPCGFSHRHVSFGSGQPTRTQRLKQLSSSRSSARPARAFDIIFLSQVYK
jgi:hypothetical protein